MNPPQRSPVSVCIIAGNEAHRITPTLQSVADWASEIIVIINDDVTDGTDKIVESFGGKVFRESWKGFGPQKNFAVAQAAQDWISRNFAAAGFVMVTGIRTIKPGFGGAAKCAGRTRLSTSRRKSMAQLDGSAPISNTTAWKVWSISSKKPFVMPMTLLPTVRRAVGKLDSLICAFVRRGGLFAVMFSSSVFWTVGAVSALLG